jgi:hypothetical protein
MVVLKFYVYDKTFGSSRFLLKYVFNDTSGFYHEA